jgi:Tfp pilus assembly protein PilX
MWRRQDGFALLSAIIITTLLTLAVISHLQTVKSELRLLQLPRSK